MIGIARVVIRIRTIATITMLVSSCTTQNGGPITALEGAAAALQRGDETALRAYADPDSLLEKLAADAAQKASAHSPLLALMKGTTQGMFSSKLRALYAHGIGALRRNAATATPKMAAAVVLGAESHFEGYSAVEANGGFATVAARFSSPDSTRPEPIVVRFELVRVNEAWRISRIAPDILEQLSKQVR